MHLTSLVLLLNKAKAAAMIALLCVFVSVRVAYSVPVGCSPAQQSFELVTGFVFTAPNDTIELVPGTLHLTECLSYCRHNATCRSVNFETGLCVLFTSSATQRPSALIASQLPVFTIYAQKICLNELTCSREWIFERVSNYELLERSRKVVSGVPAIENCMELCLKEKDFECRSANFRKNRKECQMSDMDRHSIQSDLQNAFLPAESDTDYIESNCVDPPKRLCEFSATNGKILKTVDAVFQDVKTLDGCRKKCLSVDYRCQSFDLGDPKNSVCRLSHLSSPSLANIENPYLEVPGSATYEISSCYNVSIECRSKEMVAFVRTTKMFNGKVYAKSRPNSCVTDVLNSLDFEIRMAYHDLNCDVKQQGTGEFANDIVIQHHDRIVTNQDMGVTVRCQYDLANKSVSHGVRLEVQNSEIDPFSSHSVTVAAPNISMAVTDRLGRDLFTAQVGDPLLLRFQITDPNSPYAIFVRELVAMDGIDSSEILLIDALGCPTDPLIMGPVSKAVDDSKILQVSFDAFKFPTTEVVQFKALVTPCLPACEPAECTIHPSGRRTASLGKRKRRSTDEFQEEDEVVVVQTIHITDKFGFERDKRKTIAEETTLESVSGDSSTCLNVAGLVIASSLFLVAQLIVLLAWAFVWHKRVKSKTSMVKDASPSVDMLYNSSSRRGSSFSDAYGVDNPYRGDISPYHNSLSAHNRKY